MALPSVVTGPGNDFFFAQGQADSGHTLTFARSGPVFNLGAGLTLNSVEAGIADNLLTPVPEPPAALVLAGLGLLAVRSRRR